MGWPGASHGQGRVKGLNDGRRGVQAGTLKRSLTPSTNLQHQLRLHLRPPFKPHQYINTLLCLVWFWFGLSESGVNAPESGCIPNGAQALGNAADDAAEGECRDVQPECAGHLA